MLKVKKLVTEASLPSRANPGDAGYDIVAIDDGTWSNDGTYIQYRTGIAIETPEGYHTEIFPRSSITKTDLILANSIGLIDQIYRGELLVRMKLCPRCITLEPNNGYYRFKDNAEHYNNIIKYKKGDKIAQLVIRKTETLEVEEVLFLSDTSRGSGGFGSTDKK